jgi:hypothetical protein
VEIHDIQPQIETKTRPFDLWRCDYRVLLSSEVLFSPHIRSTILGLAVSIRSVNQHSISIRSANDRL